MRITFYKSYGISLSVLLVSLLISWGAWQYTKGSIRIKEESLFLREIQEIEDAIRYRLDDYTEALFGLQSLFATEERVSHQEWQRYCDNLALSERIPGIHGLSFNSRIAGDRYTLDYIWPDKEYEELYRANLFSDPVSRFAIEQARDTGHPHASAYTSLSPESEQVLPGFIIYLPVYTFEARITTKGERQEAIQGALAAMFNASELLDNALQRINRHPGIDVEIFDGETLSSATVFYNDDATLQAQNGQYTPRYAKQVTLDIYGRPWTISFSSLSNFSLGTTEAAYPALVFGFGVIFSVMLSGMIFSLSTSQIRATRLAEKMTQQVEQQRALSMRSDRLRSLGEMAAGIAHELNQPLVGVRGLAEHIVIAQDRGWNLSDQAIRKKASTIVEQADRMTHIIEHVRIFARDAGQVELRPVDVNEVVESSLSLLGTQLASHGLHVEMNLSPDIPSIQANPFSLEEVVLNLLINARDAVEERLQAEPDFPAPGIVLRTDTTSVDGQTLARIEVSDNGVGIPEEIRAKLFDPFFTTKGPDKGTGLGLAISKSIIEDFGGQLSVISHPEDGTSATIALPITEKQQSEEATIVLPSEKNYRD